jgi:hypothetical protein
MKRLKQFFQFTWAFMQNKPVKFVPEKTKVLPGAVIEYVHSPIHAPIALNCVVSTSPLFTVNVAVPVDPLGKVTPFNTGTPLINTLIVFPFHPSPNESKKFKVYVKLPCNTGGLAASKTLLTPVHTEYSACGTVGAGGIVLSIPTVIV